MVKNRLGFILLLLLCIPPLIPLFHPGLPITHDGQDHVARIANFFQSLTEGNFVPRWAGNLNWGYGHPVIMFLYPLPSYVASLFHFIGYSFADTFKIVMGLSFVLSGVAMYLWLKEFLDDAPAATGAILYNFAPFRFVDFYVRGDIGEQVAFVFMPLVCLFLIKLSKKDSAVYFTAASLSLGGLILAHNAMSLMFIPFIVFYSIFLIYSSKKRLKTALQFLAVLVFGFLSSAFFWVPALLEGKYTLRDIVTGNEAFSRFVKIKDLFYSVWNYGQSGQLSVQVGLLHIASVVILVPFTYIAYKKKEKNFLLYLLVYIYFLVSIFIMLPESAFIWKTFTILKKFQFPWRFLALSAFASAVAGAIVMSKIPTKKSLIALIFISVFIILFQNVYWKPKGYFEKPASFFTEVYNGTTDTGESSPIWSVRFMETRPKAPLEILEGGGIVKTISRNSTHHKYEVMTTFRSRLRENTLYFPGWKIYIDGKNYQGIQFQDPASRGLMTFYVLEGKHVVDVVFENTKLRTISNWVSLASLVVLIFSPAYFFKFNLKKTKIK